MKIKEKKPQVPKKRKARFTLMVTFPVDVTTMYRYNHITGDDEKFEGSTTEEFATWIQQAVDDEGGIMDFVHVHDLLGYGCDKAELDVELLP